MKRKSRRILSMLLVAIMLVCTIFVAPMQIYASTSMTADQAISWCQSKVGSALDYDGAYGAQCVDFIMYYYSTLGVSPVGGNACDYAYNSLPSGWTRTAGGVPQKGDILIYTGGYGHVAIYESDNVSYHQNWGGQYVQKVNRPYNQSVWVQAEGVTKTYWGCIHPDFNGGTSTSNSTYTITYNANGGDGAPASQSYVYASSGVTYLSSQKPTRTGYTFLGWSLSSNATYASYSAGQYWDLSNKGDYTLYAVSSAVISSEEHRRYRCGTISSRQKR